MLLTLPSLFYAVQHPFHLEDIWIADAELLIQMFYTVGMELKLGEFACGRELWR